VIGEKEGGGGREKGRLKKGAGSFVLVSKRNILIFDDEEGAKKSRGRP